VFVVSSASFGSSRCGSSARTFAFAGETGGFPADRFAGTLFLLLAMDVLAAA
jgi:hypothetical protein